MEPIVRFDNVTKSYGALTVLDKLCLEVAEGEIISIIGPSGSGKTTVLRVLMTLEKIDDGIIYVNQQPLTHMKAKGKMVPASERHMSEMRGNIGMVFQNFNLFPHFSALRNCIEAQVRVLKRSTSEAEKIAIELLKMVNLEDKIHHYPGQLSGGQQQRVAIARALTMHPKVMLFDEVTSALDPEMVGEVLNVIRQLANEQRLTMILVTHEMGFAKEISDRICFFEEGQIREEGPPDQFFENIQNERLQAFLGAVLDTK